MLAGTNSQGGIIDGDKLSSLVDSERGTIDRRIYSDPDIYKLELERIFARAWNFMCHESQIPNTGDYFINFIGEDQVIVVRDNDGAVQVLLNTCRHRGNALCRAEQGNTKSFVCSYHGWNYGLDGRLLGIPGQKNFYRDQIDPAEWGLVKAAKVDDYKGFYFATLDPGAPDLHDFLGDVGRTGMEVLLAQGEVVAVDGVQKNIIDCNWKIAVDNLFDWYHVKISHRSAAKAGFLNPRMMMPMDQMVMLGEYGHAIGGPMISEAQQAEIEQLSDEERADIDLLSDAERAKLAPRINERRPVRKKATAEAMGPVGVRASGHPNIFPNLWISTRGMQVSLRLPRGPFETEVWWFTFMPKKFTPDQRRGAMKFISHSFGPAGLLEQDDGENWSQSTQSSRGVVSGRIPHNMQMGLGQDEVLEHPLGQKRIETRVNEHAQRWTYKCWAEWLRADDWDDLMAMRSPSPTGRI
ncbi:MAG: Rieske 2Fe-2S domain-containing protein [Alphaproteobacteria bacterium]|nr:Rieske 2Fe-2S domain-containing protein [Alphaproteobacteria bacterium]